MPFEIIRRKEGEVSQKQEIRHRNTQISINDWGHLVIREFDEPQKNDEEHLLVFDQQTTNRLINFIFSVRSTYELKKLLKDLIDNKGSLPF
jgi:hypothetical protein